MALPPLPPGFEHLHVLGVDPGTTTGFAHTVVARPKTGHHLWAEGWRPPHTPMFQEAGEWENQHQMSAWLADWAAWTVTASVPLLVGTEMFIAGSNQRHGRGQRSLQDPLVVIGVLRDHLDTMRRGGREVFEVRRSASTVKRWATDRRLQACWPLSLRAEVKGPHAKDALRHNLYAAVHAGYARDPLAPIPT